VLKRWLIDGLMRSTRPTTGRRSQPTTSIASGWIDSIQHNRLDHFPSTTHVFTYINRRSTHSITFFPSTPQPYDESMTPAVIIDDLKKRLQAKELERIRQLKANADSWNKLDAHQEQMLLRRCVSFRVRRVSFSLISNNSVAASIGWYSVESGKLSFLACLNALL
jgi:hypothetical protein